MAQPIDQEALLERVGGDAELLARLVSMFVADAPGRLATIRLALGTADAGEIARTAHALKGALAVLGADTAAAEAFRLERLGKAATLADAPAVLADLERHVETVGAALQALVRRLTDG